jgi:hypothetical protein
MFTEIYKTPCDNPGEKGEKNRPDRLSEGWLERTGEPLPVQGCKKIERNELKINR